ncbi:unnamed protein product [Mytilus coruscus]|uniref:Uncharacterized protein n=1 Tax=Mytilus coruscus TaxID=42192 RepID=A0A6J8BNA1_MYTCO|nr:unnamed protein product [Mytilus coruscus]
MNGATDNDPLLVDSSNLALRRSLFIDNLKTILSHLRLNADKYSGHSFRIGAATTCSSNGIQDHMIQTLGRWKSGCYSRYIRTSDVDIRLTCLFCNRAVNITDCLTQKATCKDNEEQCFLDKTILPDLASVFSAGCRSKQVCDLIASAVGKRSNVACAQCCNTTTNNTTLIPCNGYLCEQNPKPAGATCGVCDRVSDPKDCSVDQQCQPNEICDRILKEYRSTHNTVSTGRRADHGDLTLCSACCDTLSCNKKKCSEVIKTQTCHNSTICG